MTAVETATPITEAARPASAACVSGQVVFTIGWLLAGLLQATRYRLRGTTSATRVPLERLTPGCSSLPKELQVRARSPSCTLPSGRR